MGATLSGMLLGPHDPATVSLGNPLGASPFLLLGDHAGRAIPARLGDLGLDDADRTRHIAWDIGVAALGTALSERLDATFVAQVWSRLVIDCNRDPDQPGAIATVSDSTAIPGNVGLTASDRQQRIAEIHAPYQAAIAGEISRRLAEAMPTILVSLHSFTPTMNGFDRPWHAGVLHDRGDTGFALRMLSVMQDEPGLMIGDNAPYRMDSVDHTVPRHAYPAALPYVELEVRQDGLATDTDVALWAERISRWLQACDLSVSP